MTEIVLLIVILALTGLIGWFDWNSRKERKSYFNAIVAKDIEDLAKLEMADKIQVKIEKPKVEEPDLVPSTEISDKEFKESIEKELKEE